MRKKILALTGTRSDFVYMKPVYQAIQKVKDLSLELVITGAHFDPLFVDSLIEVKESKLGTQHYLKIPARDLSSMDKLYSTLTSHLINLIRELKPSLVLLQGDRIEMLALAVTAALNNIPIFHMSGGDQSGSIDDSIRNAISSFAHIHLTTNPVSTSRLIEKGESPQRIIEVGEPSLDRIRTAQYLSPSVLKRKFSLDDGPLLLLAQHSVTTESTKAEKQMSTTLLAISELGYTTIITYPNHDTGFQGIIRAIGKYQHNPHFHIYPHLNHDTYLSLMKIASCLVGNSSSGIIEAPSFSLPAVNIGTRQTNRVRTANIIDVSYDKEEIKASITKAITDQHFRHSLERVKNPYGDGHTAEKVVKVIEDLPHTSRLLAKWMQ